MSNDIFEQSKLRQRIIVKQNKRIKELENQLKATEAMRHFAETCSKDAWNKLSKLKSATFFQRIFQWKKLCK